MQNYNNSNDEKNVHVYKKNNEYKNNENVTTRELDFIKSYPILFIVLEWGAIIIANMNSIGAIIGSILCIGAIVGGYNYSKLHKIHGYIMLVAAAICLVVQF